MRSWFICNNQNVIQCQEGCNTQLKNINQQITFHKCNSRKSLNLYHKYCPRKSLKNVKSSQQNLLLKNKSIKSNQCNNKKLLTSDGNAHQNILSMNNLLKKPQRLKFYSPKMSIQSINSQSMNLNSHRLGTPKQSKLSKISIKYINRPQKMQSNPQVRMNSHLIRQQIKPQKNNNLTVPNKPYTAIFKGINSQKQHTGLAKSMGYQSKNVDKKKVKKLNQIQCVRAESVISDDEKLDDELSIVVSSLTGDNPFQNKNLFEQLSTQCKDSRQSQSKISSPQVSSQQITSYQ